MDLLEQIRLRAKERFKTIVLPESEDERILQAARKITEQKLAKIIMLGDPQKTGESGKGMVIIDPKKSEKKKYFVDKYFELRKNKETMENAEMLMENPLYFGCMLVREGEADGLVGGALNTTADTARAAIRVIGVDSNSCIMSSFFIIELPDGRFGENGCFFFADCGVVVEPTAEQLADIAVVTASNAKKMFGWTPRVAMLSYSTKGSAEGSSVNRIRQAIEIVRKRESGLLIDGELQLDAAIIPEVAKKKKADNILAGNANILIFPDLNSGNISYKIAQRLGGAQAIGPIFQGLAKPVNDLSRGCSVEDIINAVAVTAIQ
jgi:phosphate acetyltransferase